jgi:phosphonate transport system permease protein
VEKKKLTTRVVRNTLFATLIIVVIGISWRVTHIDFIRLITDLPKGEKLVKAFLTPDLFTRATTSKTIEIDFPIPCGSATPSPALTSGPRVVPNVTCANEREKFYILGYDLRGNSEVVVRWLFPNGREMPVVRAKTDSQGKFSLEIEARPIAASKDGVASKLSVEIQTPKGKLIPSQALKEVSQALFVTVFMALISTTVATIVAAPLSFLAASNITRRGCVGSAIYFITRSVFNLLRSYDPLVMATVFGFWLSFGPFPGVLALTVVTIASLGKLFSEAIEHIDQGPIEALNATGANRIQTVVYAVIPQIIPDFVSYIIYHWDINVRISTIIGYVGGGGIGYYLSEKINSLRYNQAGTAIWAIVAVVWMMDFLSAEVRKKLT